MRKIGNTLYITLPDVYLSLDGENVVILNQQKVIKRIPLHNLSSIVMFNYHLFPCFRSSTISLYLFLFNL